MNNNSELKRLNFFTGFFTTADDWLEGQAYHIRKLQLHHRMLHKPGVAGGLQVLPHPDGGLKVLVKQGAALDKWGNLTYLAHDATVPIDDGGVAQPLVYVTIEYSEAHENYIANVQDPDYSGYTRVAERPIIKATKETPTGNQLEVARITLESTDTEVKEKNIDDSHVQIAGSVDAVRDKLVDAVKQRILRTHQYHLEKERRHNQGLHLPGILHNVGGELHVKPAGGLRIKVETGAALDASGNEIYLPQPCEILVERPQQEQHVYIVASYDDRFAGYLEDLTQVFQGAYRTAKIECTFTEPDNKHGIELARILLKPETDPDPGPITDNDIDLGSRRMAGCISLAPPDLDPELRRAVWELARSTREHFARMARRFPSPSAEDVRHAALHMQLSLPTLQPAQLPTFLQVMADVEQDVVHELGAAYPPLPAKQEFKAYEHAVSELHAALQAQNSIDVILNRQRQVVSAALQLSEVVFEPPIAEAGANQTVQTTGNAATVLLDAGASAAATGQRIVEYIWEKAT